MDNSTYPGTETDISDNNCGFLASSSQEIDIVDHWVNLTIEDEVLRGCKLRKEKSKTCVPHSLCRLATRSNSRSPFSDDRCRSESKSRCQSYLSSYEDSPQAFCYSPRSRSIKSKCVPRCPLRIAELAIPTKRQCIENWRTKCDILPPFMVERLKQQVMDEKPIAHIADAVNCFKRGKSHKGKSPKSTRLKKSDRSSRQMSNERMSELRKLCAIFGKKIAQKLITPQNLKLNPELDKISKIVADEVANMMKTGEYKVDNMNDKMRAEISEKIAVWISTVMEDTSYKLLEEDLRVKRYNEMSNKEERLLTLVKLLPRSERTSELEEEEGPVLDFLDDVFDKVMNICNPQEIDVHGDYSDKTSKASGENNLADSLENNYFDTSTPHDTWDYMTINKSDSKLTIGDIQNEIYKVIESVVRDDTEEDEPLIDLVGKEDLSNLVPNEVINSTHAVDEQLDEPLDYYTKEIAENSEPETVDVSKEIAESSEPETVDVSKVMPVEDFIVASENLGLDNNPVDDSEGLKPDDKSSDVIGIIAEESNDDKYKKVQFSDIDLGVRGRLDKNGTPVPNNDDMNNLEATFTNIGSRDILFQPPNENLLSDADEAWPENLTAPFLKATASVSKSVTSLGNITENDEKLSTVFQENELKDLSNKQEDIQDFNKINTTEKYDKLFNELLTKTPGVINEKANDEVAYSQQLPQNDGNKDNLTGATIERIDKLPETSTAAAGYSMDYPNILQKGKTTHLTESQMSTVGDESSTNVFYQAVQQKMKTSYALSEPKFDFKVDPNTAPSWLRHDHGKGEPSEDSIIGGCRPKGKLKECELRVWCKDLERMFSNLNLWNSWLETTTKNIYCLKQTRAGNIPEMKLLGSHSKSKSAREWITLKKNIDKDANLWTKLYERANIKLKSYKRRWLWEERTEVRAPLCFHINNVVLETMEDIDRMSLWIHRTIVSTEYCMLCDCKNNFVKRKL